MEILVHPGPYTEDDLPDDNRLVELFEGTLLVNPPASPLHQAVAWRVRQLIDVPSGYEAMEAVGIRVAGGSYFIPDVAVIPVGKITADVVTLDPGDVALVVEIVSPGSKTVDRDIKPLVYAQAGIPEFWLVDTGTGLADTMIHTHRLSGDKYLPDRSFRLIP